MIIVYLKMKSLYLMYEIVNTRLRSGEVYLKVETERSKWSGKF